MTETAQSGAIYEVNLEVAPHRCADFDAWLADHVRVMLAQPGFLSAQVLKELEPAEDGWQRRTVSYRLRDRQALDDYLAGPAEAMRADGRRRFGTAMRARRRLFRLAAEQSHWGECANCGRVLYDRYCAACGQGRDSPIQSLPRVLREFLDHVFNLDGRLWRTLRDLLFRPGRLTRDYLDGRRVHYTPPFRLYILLSLVFFLSLSLIGGPELQLGDIGAASSETASAVDGAEPEDAITRCMEMDFQVDGLPWLDPSRVQRRLRGVCLQITSGDGQALYRQLVGNASTALFLMLPLMALFMRAIYPLARHSVVAHLLFLTHFQAFAFLLLFLLGLAGLVLEWLGHGVGALVWLWLAGLTGMLIWFARALRRVYDQGLLLTAWKFLLLMNAYLVGLVILLPALLIWTVVGV